MEPAQRPSQGGVVDVLPFQGRVRNESASFLVRQTSFRRAQFANNEADSFPLAMHVQSPLQVTPEHVEHEQHRRTMRAAHMLQFAWAYRAQHHSPIIELPMGESLKLRCVCLY